MVDVTLSEVSTKLSGLGAKPSPSKESGKGLETIDFVDALAQLNRDAEVQTRISETIDNIIEEHDSESKLSIAVEKTDQVDFVADTTDEIAEISAPKDTKQFIDGEMQESKVSAQIVTQNAENRRQVSHAEAAVVAQVFGKNAQIHTPVLNNSSTQLVGKAIAHPAHREARDPDVSRPNAAEIGPANDKREDARVAIKEVKTSPVEAKHVDSGKAKHLGTVPQTAGATNEVVENLVKNGGTDSNLITENKFVRAQAPVNKGENIRKNVSVEKSIPEKSELEARVDDKQSSSLLPKREVGEKTIAQNLPHKPETKTVLASANTNTFVKQPENLSLNNLNVADVSVSDADVEIPFTTALSRSESGVASSPINTSGATAAQAETARQIASQMSVAVQAKSGGVTEIALNPEELGRVKMTLSAGEGAMTMVVLAERSETAELLRRHIDTLAQEFKALGYDNLSFSFSGDGAASEGSETLDAQNSGEADTTRNEESEIEIQQISTADVGLDLRL